MTGDVSRHIGEDAADEFMNACSDIAEGIILTCRDDPHVMECRRLGLKDLDLRVAVAERISGDIDYATDFLLDRIHDMHVEAGLDPMHPANREAAAKGASLRLGIPGLRGALVG